MQAGGHWKGSRKEGNLSFTNAAGKNIYRLGRSKEENTSAWRNLSGKGRKAAAASQAAKVKTPAVKAAAMEINKQNTSTSTTKKTRAKKAGTKAKTKAKSKS